MTFSTANDRLWTSWSPGITGLCVFVIASAAFLVRAEFQIGLHAVPGSGDAPEYDLLAMELAAGNGFRFDYDNSSWREPYEGANADGRYDAILNRHGAAPTTYRPPLFPAVMAALYTSFGRSFTAVRVFNCLAMAAAGAIAAWLVARRTGPLTGLFCGVLFAVVEHRARYHAGLILTESLASLLAMLAAAAILFLSESGRLRAAFTAGLIVGLSVLNRPIAALWLPILVPLVAWITPSRRLYSAAVFAIVALLVVAPWSVRNSLLLGRFSPLGTHGQQNLAAAYSDEAVSQKGVWFNLDEAKFFPASFDSSRPGIERELSRASLSQAAAFKWMRENPEKLPLLAIMRTWQLWQPRMHWDALVLALAICGAVLWPSASERRILIAFLAANTVAVAATWSVGGRFLVPVLPIIHMFASCGLWVALLAMFERRVDVRGWFSCRRISRQD